MAQTHIDLDFADGRYRFRLNLPQIDELQSACDGAGIFEIYGRVLAGGFQTPNGEILLNPAEGRAKLLELTETIRLGLIGGNHGLVREQEIKVGPLEAARLIERYIYPRPLIEAWEIAFAVLGACIIGYTPPPEDEPGNDQAAAETTADQA